MNHIAPPPTDRTQFPPRRRAARLGTGAAALLLVVITVGAIALLASGTLDNDAAPAFPTATPPIPSDLAPDAVTERAFPSLTYGIHAFLWWHPTYRAYDLDNIRLMQFSHVKQRFSWVEMEPNPGEWHWDRADAVVDEVAYRGLELVARLDGPPEWALRPVPPDDPTVPPVDVAAWGTFCGELAGRYQGRIAAYQVWNEPNLRREWAEYPPDPVGYVTLLQACAAAIRAADPDAVIISAALAPTGTLLPDAIPDIDYLRQMYDAGAAPWFDVLGLNAPGYGAPPDLGPDEAEQQGRLRWMTFRHVEDMRAIMVARGDAHKQVALLEVGWTTDARPDSSYAWHAVDEETQAEYLYGAYRYAAEHWRPWVGLMVTIYLADIEWDENDEEWWWALNDGGFGEDWGGRPAYYRLANMERWIDDEFFPSRNPGAPEAVTVDPLPDREDE